MLDLSTEHEFRPALLSRRAELLAWGLSIVMLVTWWILQLNQARYTTAAVLLAVFLVFAAVGTSLSNWIERRSVLRIDENGVGFENGLRNVSFSWADIRSVRVLPSSAGSKRIQVIGEKAHFEFRTLAEIKLSGVVKGQSGFAEGEDILNTILEKTKLPEGDSSAPYTYYARD